MRTLPGALTTFIAIFFLSPAFASAAAFDLDCTLDDKTAEAQIRKLSCELRDLAKHINENQETVPKTIYHFGREEFMRRHAEKKTITQDRWDEFIMGNKTRFDLRENRRGLYGTAGIHTNGFGSEPYNWLIEIRIKDECRKPENVVTFYDLPKSNRFKDWFARLDEGSRKFESVEDFAAKCFANFRPGEDYQGHFGGVECSSFVNDYLVKSNVKVVQDQAIQKSFYIRDRNCIESINGTPKELIEMAAKKDILWMNPCLPGQNFGGFSYSQGTPSLSRIVGRALARYEGEVPNAVIGKLKANLKLSGNPPDHLDAYVRCRDSGRLGEYRALFDPPSPNQISVYPDVLCRNTGAAP